MPFGFITGSVFPDARLSNGVRLGGGVPKCRMKNEECKMKPGTLHSALGTLHFRGTSGYSPVFCRAVAADKSDALANFRQRIFPVAFVFDGKIASEALAS